MAINAGLTEEEMIKRLIDMDGNPPSVVHIPADPTGYYVSKLKKDGE